MKSKIITATQDLISQSGFRKFKVDDIAHYLSISKKTIYKYFLNKDEIVSAVIDTVFENAKSKTMQLIDQETDWLKKVKIAILFHHMNKISINLFEEVKYFYPKKWEKVIQYKEFKKAIIKELLEYGIQNNYLKKDISIEIILLILESTIPNIFHYDFLAQNNYSVNQAIEEMIKIIFYGIIVPA